jgi:cleavage stimulation factor subunit 1
MTGALVATGSADCSIKILDVDRIIARDMTPDEIADASVGEAELGSGKHIDLPVVRTLYDHIDVSCCCLFHSLLLFNSGSHMYCVSPSFANFIQWFK